MALSEHIENTIRAVIMLLKGSVLDNVVQATHADYGEIARLPALILYFPRITEVRTEASNEQVVERKRDTGEFRVFPPPRFYDLEFDYELVTATMVGAQGLSQLSQKCLTFFAEHPAITVNLTDEQGNVYGADTYEIAPTLALSPGAVSAYYFTVRGSFVVREVRVEDRRSITGPLVRGFEVAYRDERKEIEEAYRHL
ncbi:MAG TPA: hypothetical protein GXX51_05720 [Firmicutes bacterium]|nr:hypothetical protein [Bacillota bacterium]